MNYPILISVSNKSIIGKVFGDEIDIYDMVQANDDGATVPIYYESRLVNLELPEEAKIVLNDLAEQLVEDEEAQRHETHVGDR